MRVFVCFAVLIMPTYIAPLADKVVGSQRQGALSNPRVRGPPGRESWSVLTATGQPNVISAAS